MTKVSFESLFVFGTMRDRDVLEAVLGRPVASECIQPALLHDHRAVRVPDERYPVLAKSSGHVTHGEVIHGLDAEDLARVAFFEGAEYEIAKIEVCIEGVGEARVLFCDDAVMDPGAVEAWDLEAWRAEQKASYLAITRKFMALYGRSTSEEADALWIELETARHRQSAA